MALLNKEGIIIIIQFQSGEVGLDQGWLDAPHSLSNLSLPFCILGDLQPRAPPTQFIHVLFNLPPPHLLWPSSISRLFALFTSSINAFFRTLSSSLLITCSYHNTLFTFAILSNVSFKPSISINSSSIFLSTNFTPQPAY